MSKGKLVLALVGLIFGAFVAKAIYSGIPRLSFLVQNEIANISEQPTFVSKSHSYAQNFSQPLSQAKLMQSEIANLSQQPISVSENHTMHVQNFSEPPSKAKSVQKNDSLSLQISNFLQNLKKKLQLLPIKCFSGNEGLFPNKYDKLLLALAEYATFHSKAGNAYYLIWKCEAGGDCGGLGDRLRGIALTLLLAVFSRRRLLLYWGMPNGEHIYLKPNVINWKSEKSDVERATFFSVMELNSALKAISPHNSVNIAMNTNFELEFIKTTKNRPQWLIDGVKKTGLDGLSNREINELFGIAFRYLFQFRDDVIPIVNAAKHSMSLNEQNYVAVHVRTGFIGSSLEKKEYKDHTQKLLSKKKQWKQMLTCAVSVANSTTRQSSPIFLATDSKLVKDLARQMYGSRFKTLDVVLTHVDFINKKTGPNKAERKGLLSVWMDFLLLAQSYAQVRSGADWIWGSGFALGSSHLCALPRNRTFIGLKNCIF